MMLCGDQWLCPCGWHNLFLRTRCRNCREPKLENETLEAAGVSIQRVYERSLAEREKSR